MKVNVDDDVHRRAKAAAARNGKPLRRWVEEVLRAAVEEDEVRAYGKAERKPRGKQ
jgi:predicted HicB family RNase H-like nuclease